MPRGRTLTSISLKFTILDVSKQKKVRSVNKSIKDEFYNFLSTTQGDVVDRYIEGSTLIVEIAVYNKKEADKIGKDIQAGSEEHADHTEFGFVLVYKGNITEEKIYKTEKTKKKMSTSPSKYNKKEPVVQLNVMQSSLPREVYMIPVAYFEKNKKVKIILDKHMDVDADVEDTTWAEFYKSVSRKLGLNMDKEFNPFIFKEGGNYTITEMWWIDYE